MNDIEKILETLEEFPTETRVKAWVFHNENDYYQVVEYGGVYGVTPRTAIWKATKRGKRKNSDPIFRIEGNDHEMCVREFFEKNEKLSES